jgi:manganese/iron transport system permease protein
VTLATAFDWVFWAPVLVGCLAAGGSTALLGVFVVGMRVPFLGVCVSHAALAGAVFGSLAGLSGPALLAPALAGSLATALLLGLWDPWRSRLDTNVLMGMLFSLSMGLAFLGLGLFGETTARNDALTLLWGNITFARWPQVGLMSAAGVAIAAFVALFAKEMRALLFSRAHAEAAGVHATAVWTAFLVLTAVVLTANFQTVGGLMIYSLMTNPAAAALLLVRGFRATVLLAAAMGAATSVGGFALAWWTGAPIGAAIVILSAAAVGVAGGLRGLWGRSA